MTNLDELHALVDELPEAARDQARVLLLALVQGLDEGLPAADRELLDRMGRSGDDVLAEIDADPALRERFDASLRRTAASLDRGEGTDGAAFMADMRDRSRQRRAGA